LDEEIKGITVSTGLRLEEIYFLQIRAEIEVFLSKLAGENIGMECTTFALSGLGTADGVPLAGQNADLPAFYSEVCIVVEIVSDDSTPILMVTPAGQVSYIGMNLSGLCVFANFLVCDGWRIGFPRYCLSRLALTQDTVVDAEQILTKVYRASSRNLLMADIGGEILDLEFAVERYGRLTSPNGRLIHSNHFISPDLLDEERSSPGDLKNSHTRLSRFQHLIDNAYLRDRVTYPDPVCSELGDPGQGDEMTVASVIAEPAKQCIWAAIGPPSLNIYKCYTFTGYK
jgi:isopenicillin-N N-acyltransferase-like protein